MILGYGFELMAALEGVPWNRFPSRTPDRAQDVCDKNMFSGFFFLLKNPTKH